MCDGHNSTITYGSVALNSFLSAPKDCKLQNGEMHINITLNTSIKFQTKVVNKGYEEGGMKVTSDPKPLTYIFVKSSDGFGIGLS